ncbi:unnamed protein product [Echinostoma caproni]|uniref:Uncharacterized protein n=1 Tax=Echinostoma caproni TaxID=27848 RepID=A0A183ADT3_9TREM|nr:unnamed protein product [Echinostoma caproni]
MVFRSPKRVPCWSTCVGEKVASRGVKTGKKDIIKTLLDWEMAANETVVVAPAVVVVTVSALTSVDKPDVNLVVGLV